MLYATLPHKINIMLMKSKRDMVFAAVAVVAMKNTPKKISKLWHKIVWQNACALQ